MKDYNLEQLFTYKTIVEGYPRNTIFSDEEAGKKMKEKLGYKDKTVYAYMPTWRGANSYGKMSIEDIEVNLLKMDKALDNIRLGDNVVWRVSSLDNNHIMHVNLHPNIGSEIDFTQYKHIEPFPEDIPSYEFINSVDALITDYSSIFFDFSITKKPIVLFMYDYEEYMAERGMYLDVRELPFKEIYNIDDMCAAIKSNDILTYRYDDAKDYFDTFTKDADVDCTKKLVDYIFNGEPSDLKIEDYSGNAEKEWKICVQPERIDSKEEYDEFLSGHDLENTIFVIKNDYFHALMNKWFYEDYNNKLTYIIFGYSRLINNADEEIFNTTDSANKPKRKIVKDRARERAYQRSLPNIKIINKQDNKRII